MTLIEKNVDRLTKKYPKSKFYRLYISSIHSSKDKFPDNDILRANYLNTKYFYNKHATEVWSKQ